MEKFVTTSKYKELTPAEYEELKGKKRALPANWEEGFIFSWPVETEKTPVCSAFRSAEDAKEYWEVKFQINGVFDGPAVTPITYIIGTEKDYLKAVADFEAKKKQNEKKAYIADVNRRVKIMDRDVKALETLKDVCSTFDGKVINCRFNTAVKAETGYYLSLESGRIFMRFYDCKNHENESTISIRATYYNEVDYLGQPKVAKPDDWRWDTGDRMEADKAALVIDSKINYYKTVIDELQGTKKQYTEYLRKARRVEKLIEELNGYSYYIQNWAKEHDLKTYVSAGNIWRG